MKGRAIDLDEIAPPEILDLREVQGRSLFLECSKKARWPRQWLATEQACRRGRTGFGTDQGLSCASLRRD
jgi:hypothetical protein